MVEELLLCVAIVNRHLISYVFYLLYEYSMLAGYFRLQRLN